MRVRRLVLAAALAGGLFRADVGAAQTCGGFIQYFDWACREVADSGGWLWQLEHVGTRICDCGSPCFLSGQATSCYRSELTDDCTETSSCQDNTHEVCNLPAPDPATCTGPLPRDREGWARHDGRAATYTPPLCVSYNSRGFGYANEITNEATGEYIVKFPGLGGRDGNVQVVAYGTNANRCTVRDWKGSPDLRVYVSCHTPAGVPANTPFLVYFLATDDTAASAREIAYARYDHDSPPVPPDPAFQWNSNGPLPVTTRLEAGSYTVRFRNLMHASGAAVVTALGSGPEFCQVLSTGIYTAGAETGTEVRVWCFDSGGRLADSSFTLRYEWRAVVAGAPRSDGYAYANQSTAASYTPSPQFNSTGAVDAAARLDTGRYEIFYPGLADPTAPPVACGSWWTSTVLLSARTLGPSYCKVVSWAGSIAETTVKAQCFNYAGAPGDRTYQEMYLTRFLQPRHNP